ncbi:MAG: ABC transporter substrate-binding protein [Schleiferilactobacillus harbinensis]|jgi:multiple sugar transport system substrate-binding protein|nr:ABC transporter substrate-binding protein [Schleiferilactobacillus harbinensis]MCI1914058.1 ABC transporter substrate-binding protein [Schleiferilactobacillus harbinensis]
MKKTKLLALVSTLALAAMLIMAGCSNSNSSSSSSSSKSTKPVTITYWHRMTGSWDKAQQKLIDKFNKSQNKYKVVATSQGSYDALQQKIMAAAKSKTLPVMAQAPYTNIGDYVKSSLLQPLDSEINSGANKWTADEKADVDPAFWATGTYKGKQYATPYSLSTRVLFYNKDLLKKYNLKVPKTWEELASYGETLKKDNLYTLIFDSSYDMELEGMAYAAGSQYVTPKLKVNMDNPKTIKAENTLMDLINKGYARTAGEDKYFSYPFSASKTVFGIGSSATIPALLQQAPKTLNWDTALVPEYNGKSTSALAGNDNVVFKGATKAQQDGAWAFMKFLMKTDNTAQWAVDSGYTPVTKSGVQSKIYQNYLKKVPQFKAAAEANDHSFASTIFAGYGEFRNNLLEFVDHTVTKKADPTAELKTLQQKTEQTIKENN